MARMMEGCDYLAEIASFDITLRYWGGGRSGEGGCQIVGGLKGEERKQSSIEEKSGIK